MKKVFVSVLILLFILDLNFVSSISIDSEIKKITSYAEDFETGNINYVQLLVYSSAVREEINKALGATNKEIGGILKEEQLSSILGEPTEKTNWVWSENGEKEIKLNKEAPAWRKIIFDGKKIQIWINSWPSVFEKSEGDALIYRLNFEIHFKELKEELNIEGKISEIKALAEKFNKDSNRENAEILAEESVNAEKIFEINMRQNPGKCEDIMKNIFGAENRKESQKMLVQEVEFYEGKNFDVTARLEMCDECEWKWINLDMWINGRGGFRMPKQQEEFFSEQFQNLDFLEYKKQIQEILNEAKSSLEQGNYERILSLNSKMKAINEAWNQKSNNIWQEVEKTFQRYEEMTPEQQSQLEEYWWIKQEQQKREKVKEIVNKNYQERKDFYLNLFSSYEKKEFYFSQVEYEKRLVEEFKESGKEICNNNIDDNKNDKIDCFDEQCLGKRCGKQKVSVRKGNETAEEERDLFCIERSCQLKEEIIKEEKSICGNHICENNETESCKEDCIKCRVYDAINCSGKVIFKGVDEDNCPLEPICLNETDFCKKNEDCIQPLCGKAECIKRKCKTIELEECKEAKCINGEEKIENCENGEKIVVEICQEEIWKKTGAECRKEIRENITSCESYCAIQPRIMCIGESEVSGTYPDCKCEFICRSEVPVADNECKIKEDCGNENDVCSNGKCVTLPEAIQIPPPESITFPVTEQPTEQIGQLSPSEQQPSQQEHPQSSERQSPLSEPQPQTETQEHQETTEQTLNQEIQEQQDQETQSTVTNPEINQQSQQPKQTPATGNVIYFIKTISEKVTGFVIGITGFDVEETTQQQEQQPIEQPKQEKEEEEQKQSSQEQDDKKEREGQEQQSLQEQEFLQETDREKRENQERGIKQREEEERREKDCKNNCDRKCKDNLISSCVGNCVRNSQCKESSCIDEEIKKCEESCKQEKGFDKCVETCYDECLIGEHLEIEEQREEHKEEKGVFKIGGACRAAQGTQRTESFIFFDGWGDPFKQIQPLKQKYYSGGNADWCKKELENLLKQRKELEQGLNQDFVVWFFEKYLANSADEWEQHVSGIFELYWRDVELSKQIAERMNCLDMKEMPQYNLINTKYESDYGKLELWEEIKNVKLPNLEDEMQIISPYMKIWIFPPKSFIIYEMKKSMKNHEFPGPAEQGIERENEEGPTAEEREIIKQDRRLMNQIKKIAEKYNKNLDVVIRFIDDEKVVFNLYAQVNENDIMKIKPMLPEEVPQEDARIEIEFQKLYDIIYIQEKEMRGERIESPPWDRKTQPIQKIKETINNIKVYFKVRDMLNSAKISPEASEKDIRALMKSFFSMIIKSEKERPEMELEMKNKDIGKEKDIWEKKEKITGEVIAE